MQIGKKSFSIPQNNQDCNNPIHNDLQTKEKNLEHQLFVLDTFAALLPEVD